MRVLLSNDDGYLAEGLRALTRAVAAQAVVDVVAPDRNRSGASSSLTLTNPLRAHDHGDGVWSVEGTPCDCVLLAVGGLLEHAPDMVISGINNGPNMGDDVIYSGTVAAAIEGRHLGFPALAVSMSAHRPGHYETGARVAVDILNRMVGQPLPADTILNVNVPDRPYDTLAGYRVTRLGTRAPGGSAEHTIDPRGEGAWWIGPAGAPHRNQPDTDFAAVDAGFVSVTPLQIDLTRYTQLAELKSWLGPEHGVDG
ncbi:MAG: 5'/3'-nucleotidase SurE [Pseudomonadota bacterium]